MSISGFFSCFVFLSKCLFLLSIIFLSKSLHLNSFFFYFGERVKVTRSCLTLCSLMNHIVHGLLQARILKWPFPFSRGIFPTQRSNPGLLHCKWILYQLNHKGSPFILVVLENEVMIGKKKLLCVLIVIYLFFNFKIFYFKYLKKVNFQKNMIFML